MMAPTSPVAPRAAQRAPGSRLALLALLSVVLGLWQLGFASASHESRRPWAMNASMGMSADAPRFFYFFDHLGLFPVAAQEVPQLGPTKADALAFVAQHGDRLATDLDTPTSTARFGDYGKMFLFFPDAWLRGDPGHATAIPFNRILFVIALLAVLAAFAFEGHLLLGVSIVVLVGSDPFQILEVNARGNVFSVPISLALLALAAHVRYLTGRHGADVLAFLTAAASGVVLASFREVRTEAALMVPAVLATYALMRAPLARRAAMVLLFLVTFAGTGRAWSCYWSTQFTRAEAFVTHAGGNVFHATHGSHHAFWHAIACGLGDYGGDRGYSWDDRASFRWATTYDAASNPKPLPYHYTRGYFLDETYDGVHPIAPTDLPAYNDLVSTRVLRDIRQHPAWYAGVLGQRVLAILRDATPAALSLGPFTLAVPGAGWLLLPVLAYALLRRRYFHAALIAFTLPLSVVALLVYSGRGATFYGIAHLIALAVAIELFVRARTTSSGRPADVR